MSKRLPLHEAVLVWLEHAHRLPTLPHAVTDGALADVPEWEALEDAVATTVPLCEHPGLYAGVDGDRILNYRTLLGKSGPGAATRLIAQGADVPEAEVADSFVAVCAHQAPVPERWLLLNGDFPRGTWIRLGQYTLQTFTGDALREVVPMSTVEGFRPGGLDLGLIAGRACPRPFPGPLVRLRRVWAARRPPHCRRVLGTGLSPRTAPRDVPPHPRSALFPRLLLDRRRHPLGCQPPEEGRREHPGRTEVDPRCPPGRRPRVILDNLSAHRGEQIRRWVKKIRVELCFTPTYACWANPIEAHFGPLRQFTVANSHHRNRTVQTRALHPYLGWRNKNARHPDLLAAQRRERARIRSEKGIRWGGRPITAAACKRTAQPPNVPCEEHRMDHQEVRAAVPEMLEVLGPRMGEDWTVPAGPLEWSCWQTAAHIGHDLLAYAGQLAARSTDAYLLFDLRVRPTASPAEVLQVAAACGGLLGSALATADPSLRAWHWGPCDPTGFAAMGVAEILLHTHDITRGLGVDWLPPALLFAAVLDRLFPDAPPGEPVPVLLWCTGRGDLDGLPRRTSWTWKAALPD